VLVTGETGTGKELVARAIHTLSRRRDAPFVAVNCAALVEGLLESELFGHVRGAFTGAVRDRAGAFEAAHGGTLFLDEIGDVGPGFQQRLLRVLQEGELTRVGATQATRVDVRVVAATHHDLRSRVAEGTFRQDLYYRLAVFPVAVPPLRARAEDVPLLVEHFLDRHREGRGMPLGALGALGRGGRAPARHGATLGEFAVGCSPLATRLLQRYAWPGNVRELSAAVASALIRSGGGRIETQHLPPEIRDAGASSRYQAATSADAERAAILDALRETGGALALAAQRLGMGRTTLWRKMKAYDIHTPAQPDLPNGVESDVGRPARQNGASPTAK
jgi:two-component system, NtrC family, response regulator HydG